MIDARRELLLETVEMVIALGQYQRRTAVTNRLDNVLADSPTPRLILNQLLIQGLEFYAPIRIRASVRLWNGVG